MTTSRYDRYLKRSFVAQGLTRDTHECMPHGNDSKGMLLMRYILPLLVSIIFCTNSALAEDKTVTLPESGYQAILDRLDALQDRVEVLEQENTVIRNKLSVYEKSAPPPEQRYPYKQDEVDVDELYTTLDKVENRTLKDKINWGAELRSRVDNFSLRGRLDPDTGRNRNESNDNHWTNRFRLNLDAELTDDLHFSGRLTGFKNWGDSDTSLLRSDGNFAHVPDGASISFDRLFAEWTLPIHTPMSFTFGRLSTTEGPPLHMGENRPMESFFPSLLLDAELDGMMLSTNLDSLTGLQGTTVTLLYGKGFQDDNDQELFLDGRSGIDDTDLAGLFIKTALPYVPDGLLMLSAVRGSKLTDTPLDPETDLGSVDLLGIHSQACNIFDTGLDAFASWGMSLPRTNGRSIMFSGPTSGSMMPSHVGLLSGPAPEGSDVFEKDRTGWAVYAGLRYTLPIQKLKEPKLGFEYNHGSRYWFSFTQGAPDLFNKLSVRGDVYDLYYIQPVNPFLFIRTGYTFAELDYSRSGMHVAQPQPIEEKLGNFYFLFDCRF